MLNLDEINKEILMLESNRDTTYAVVEKLAMLYTVRDHITGQTAAQPVPLEVAGESEFLQAIDGRDSVKVWAIMDELMDSIRVINQRTYDAVMRRICEI